MKPSASRTILEATKHLAQGKLRLMQSGTMVGSRSRELHSIASELNRVIEPLTAIRQALLLEELHNG
jgi:hypothetical protein